MIIVNFEVITYSNQVNLDKNTPQQAPENPTKTDSDVTIKTRPVAKMAKNIPTTSRQISAEKAALATPEHKVQVNRNNRAKIANNLPLFESNQQAISRTAVVMPYISFANIQHFSDKQNEREIYQHYPTNSNQLVSQQPVSTFSIDVDTGSYTNVRRVLHEGKLPPSAAVRVEEFINYFSYQYPANTNSEIPFSVVTEIGPNPWNTNTHLLHIGIKGYDVSNENLPAANLVFLLDVSGSMNSPDKLPLLKNALRLLTNKLRPQDSVAIVVYAGASGTVLHPTSGNQKTKIFTALNSLSAGGSTNGAAGIRLAYQLARQAFIKNGINRVILATDGDFNVGTTDLSTLKSMIKRQRETDISLTTLGFGHGNYNDSLMEQLADIGNGNYAYIDNLLAAQKSLVDEFGSTLFTIAKDVKIQIEFNPDIVQEYRLVGYENRALKRQDFNNDKVDAGDIGAGHTVTAIYEISLVSGKGNRIDPLRYQSKVKNLRSRKTNELAFVKIRYKHPKSESSKLISQAINLQSIKKKLESTTQRYQFSSSVAAFAQLLQNSDYMQNFTYDHVIDLARSSKGEDINGYRGEFINLVKLADSLNGSTKLSLK